MELAGDEKKIQALFLELKTEDGRVAPAFARLWNRAQVASQKPRRVLRTSFEVATVLLVITLCALAFWSRSWQRGQPDYSGVAGGVSTPRSTPAPVSPKAFPKQLVQNDNGNRIRPNRWPRKLAVRGQTLLGSRDAAIRDVVAISSWQSPTATLMQSPVDDLLTSLPQLNRAVTEFRLFLPRAPKVKESQ